ncbi:hypothetical protein TYRP_009710 [Tyrophagus putrescentiae]|nr:hypothetical protein TYRP_009710 [Tyrophagus putrescentiae]
MPRMAPGSPPSLWPDPAYVMETFHWGKPRLDGLSRNSTSNQVPPYQLERSERLPLKMPKRSLCYDRYINEAKANQQSVVVQQPTTAAAQRRLTPLTLMVSNDTPIAAAKRRRQGPTSKTINDTSTVAAYSNNRPKTKRWQQGPTSKIIKNTPIAPAKRRLVHTILKIITLLRPF